MGAPSRSCGVYLTAVFKNKESKKGKLSNNTTGLTPPCRVEAGSVRAQGEGSICCLASRCSSSSCGPAGGWYQENKAGPVADGHGSCKATGQ